jgi:hypothetical protein
MDDTGEKKEVNYAARFCALLRLWAGVNLFVFSSLSLLVRIIRLF